MEHGWKQRVLEQWLDRHHFRAELLNFLVSAHKRDVAEQFNDAVISARQRRLFVHFNLRLLCCSMFRPIVVIPGI